ncbi:MAG: hypothetical protein M3Y85_09280, partial [Bacteroidota bacterium]|nr:hypothetical protein [Bacteroidota bacterium]
PMLHASSAQTVYTGLAKAVKDKDSLAAMGQKGREWFLNYCVDLPITSIKKIIDQKSRVPHA